MRVKAQVRTIFGFETKNVETLHRAAGIEVNDSMGIETYSCVSAYGGRLGPIK